MKTFTKWVGRAGITFSFIFIILYVTGQVEIEIEESVLILLMGSTLIGGFFYLIEDKYFPIRKRQILKKIIRIFNAEQLSESQARFRTGEYDVIVDIDFILSLLKYAANGEVINFHVPRNQLHSIKLKRPLSMIEDSINGELTYRIYQTNGMGLKLAKGRINQGLL